MLKKLLFSILIINASFCSATLCELDRPYKIVMPGSYTVEGKNSEQMEAFTLQIVEGLSNSVGVRIELEISPYTEEEYILRSLLRMLRKEVDFVGFNGDWYAKMNPWLRGRFPIFFGLVIDKKTHMNNCFYVRKSDEVETVEELRGKIIGGYLYLDARYLLFRAGIDEPILDFFSNYVFIQGPYTDHMSALVEGEIDVFSSWDFNVNTSLNLDPRFVDIEKIGCKKYGLNPFIIYRKGLDEELVENARNALMNWKSDSNFQNVRLFFMAIKGGIAALDDEDMEFNLKLNELTVENGWDVERREFLDIFRPEPE